MLKEKANLKSEMAKVGVHIVVEGMVQGVFFRSNTCDQAAELNVTGWVKNLPDGRLEAVFEGDKKNVEKIVKWCRHGPPNAYVTKVEIRWGDYTGEFKDFGVRYY